MKKKKENDSVLFNGDSLSSFMTDEVNEVLEKIKRRLDTGTIELEVVYDFSVNFFCKALSDSIGLDYYLSNLASYIGHETYESIREKTTGRILEVICDKAAEMGLVSKDVRLDKSVEWRWHLSFLRKSEHFKKLAEDAAKFIDSWNF